MTNRETVIKALHHCTDETPQYCRQCPYYVGNAQCITNLMLDALELIEEVKEE